MLQAFTQVLCDKLRQHGAGRVIKEAHITNDSSLVDYFDKTLKFNPDRRLPFV